MRTWRDLDRRQDRIIFDHDERGRVGGLQELVQTELPGLARGLEGDRLQLGRGPQLEVKTGGALAMARAGKSW
jgi:hypothetical protein